MRDSAEPDWRLALVLREADMALIGWIRQHHTLALRVFPDDRALGLADRPLACDVVVVMRSGEDLEPPVLEAYEIERPFVLTPGAELAPGYPRLAPRESYWTAKLHTLADEPDWQALAQDAEARSDELFKATPADTPPAIWIAAALHREADSSYET